MLFALKHIVALGLLAGSTFALPVTPGLPVTLVTPVAPVAPVAANGTAPPGALASDGKAAIEFSYYGNQGPKLWPDFCQDPAAGQSPVDIRTGSADVNAGQLRVDFRTLTSVSMENKGDGVKFTPAADAAKITFVPVGQPGGAQEVFTMEQFHLHTPSEHTLKGKFFDAEMHMVFKSAAEQIAVVGVFMQISATSQVDPMFALIEQALPLKGATVDIPNFDLYRIAALANHFTGFFTYTGSLTTPPCSPNVLWHVMKTPVDIPVSLALALRDEQGMNARFSQVARDEVPAFNGGLVTGAALAPNPPPVVDAPPVAGVPPVVVAPTLLLR